MKLATYKDGSRDGQLLVVSRDLRQGHFATSIATRLQVVLDDWNFMAPQLEALSALLNQGRCRHAFAFDPALCMAPLPRAFQCVASGSSPAQALAGDVLLGATDDLPLPEGEGEIVAFPALAAYTGDLPQGATREQVLNAARLHALALRVELRPAQAAQGGAAASAAQPRIAFSPVAVTPDEWLIGRQAPGRSKARGGELALGGRLKAGGEGAPSRMGLGVEFESLFSALIGGASRDREVRAGSVFAVRLGSAVPAGAPGTSPAAASPWPLLQPGDQLRVECLDAQGDSVFGAIEHTLRDQRAAEAQN